jgi:hypothetical protein
MSDGVMLSNVAVRLNTSCIEGRSFSPNAGTGMLENGDLSLYDRSRSADVTSGSKAASLFSGVLVLLLDSTEAASGSSTTSAITTAETNSSSPSVLGAKKCTVDHEC